MTQAKTIRQRVILLATNSSQSIIGESVEGKINTIGYTAYGEQSAQQEVATALGFNGQLREARFGWYLPGNGYRAYNTRLMRFHSPDSWSPFGGGGLNAYMYCVGDPVNRVDPTGHIADALILFIRENIRYRTPQKLANANTRAIARQEAISPLSRSSRSVEPLKPSRQSDAVSAIGGYIMGAPGARNPTPSPGGDLAPQNIKGWERPLPGQGNSWKVSSTAQQSHSPGARRGGGSPSAGPTRPMPPPTYEEATSMNKFWDNNSVAAAMQPPVFEVYKMTVSRTDNLATAAPYQMPAGAHPPRPAPLVREHDRLVQQLAELNNMQRDVIRERANNIRCRIL